MILVMRIILLTLGVLKFAVVVVGVLLVFRRKASILTKAAYSALIFAYVGYGFLNVVEFSNPNAVIAIYSVVSVAEVISFGYILLRHAKGIEPHSKTDAISKKI